MALTLVASAAALLPAKASAQSDFDAQFVTYPTYSGDDLELAVNDSGTHFRLWSPKAQEARVLLYANGHTGAPCQTLPMTFDAASGTWSASVPEKLFGKFYTFQIRQNDKWLDETPGVWAKAVGVNGKRAAIIDFATTDPAGWCCDKGPVVKSFSDVIIYEMHHVSYTHHRPHET